jgi:hypothetical protein
MKKKPSFDILVLNARPAAGKSEVIDYLKRCSVEERQKRFMIAEFEEIDDFPMLWTWFEEDDILQKMGIHACTVMSRVISSGNISGIY